LKTPELRLLMEKNEKNMITNRTHPHHRRQLKEQRSTSNDARNLRTNERRQ
jgi:hypothetical protein